MALVYRPIGSWYLLAFIGAGMVTLFLFGRLLIDRNQQLGATFRKRFLIFLGSIIAAWSLFLATYNPVILQEPETKPFHLAIVVDVSDSILRIEGGWEVVKSVGQQFIEQQLLHLPEEMKVEGQASFVFFFRGMRLGKILIWFISWMIGCGLMNPILAEKEQTLVRHCVWLVIM